MPIKNEIVDFLEKNLSAKAMVGRNIDVVLYHYGFTGEIAPTLETTAQHFGIGTRERIRQILMQSLLSKACLVQLPTLNACNTIITRQPIWLLSELKEALQAEIGDEFETSLQNLIYLIQDLGGAKNLAFFDCKFIELTRPAVSRSEDCFITTKAEAKVYQKIMRSTRTLPGVLGIAAVGYIDPAPLPLEYYRKAIEIDPTTWVHYRGDTMFFMYEARDNFLINSAEKVFAVHSEVNITRLAEAMYNGLTRRSTKHVYPPVDLIETYLRESRHFSVEGDTIRFKGEQGGLTDIEVDTVGYLKEVISTSFRPLRDFLLSKGYTKVHVYIHANYSPIVHLARNEKNEKLYTLVGEMS